jgi:hypothetical protein
MSFLTTRAHQAAEAFAQQGGVLDTAIVLRYLTSAELDWQVRSARWQRPCKGVVVDHSGPLTNDQLLRIALLRSGAGAALAGLTAARLDGFTGFVDTLPTDGGPVHVLAPRGFKKPVAMPGLALVIHRSKFIGAADVHPTWDPRRTRMPRSLIDAAVWQATDRGALAILAAGVQQRRVRVADLREVVERIGATLPRRRLILEALSDIEGGAQALSELDFTRKVIRRFRLPEPERQASRKDKRGRQRWIDVVWEKYKVIVEVDGAQHIEALNYWDDMDRGNGFTIDGYRLLRFPAWVVRRQPEYVAEQILKALHEGGYPAERSTAPVE